MEGAILSHYKILEKLGEGGMGILYSALDTRLERTVAIKLLRPEAMSPERKQRFIREAKAASALNHPHIITIHDIGEAPFEGVDRDFIVMEYVDGSSLDRILEDGPLPPGRVLHLVVQVADGLSAAHEAGIVHRDLKPANIMVTRKGEVKIVDFGLAKLTEPRTDVSESAPTRSAGLRTEEGTVLGTAAYMSPEQAEGRPVDVRSDVFSLGSVLYEMLTGRRPFSGDSNISTRMAILGHTPPALRSIRPDLPVELERIVERCLEKNREARYPSGEELCRELDAVKAHIGGEAGRRRSPMKRVVAAALVASLLAIGAWLWRGSSRTDWARYEAIPEIERLSDEEEYIAAFELVRQAREVLPNDRELERLWNIVSSIGTIRTEPSGADVYWKDFTRPDRDWQLEGQAPLEDIPFPASLLRWRFVKEGFEPLELVFFPYLERSFTLHPEGSVPPGMVWVPPGREGSFGKDLALEGFWLDQYEVTNRHYKEFVDAGGYRKRDYWKEAFVKDGRELPFEEAMRLFVDRTGRPGPSTWELGAYPEGEDDHPVQGVSWYEAGAYAAFAGKSLPTVHHWFRATDGLTSSPWIQKLSNYDGTAAAPVGHHQGLGPFGHYDMAGNVKEWCWNASEDRRYTLGGAWGEPIYMFRSPHAQSPFDRTEIYGFRCAKYENPPSDEQTAPIERFWRDYTLESPVDDEVYRLYASMYAYDRTELGARVETLSSGSPLWRKEKITFDATYGDDNVIAYLFLPGNADPPFQTVVYFPGSGALSLPSHEDTQGRYLDFVIRSGRALLFPIYNGMYERRLDDPPTGSRGRRDRNIQWYQDLARSIDYLETREDIDTDKLAYYGWSLGARLGNVYTALETRFQASILFAGGFDYREVPGEVDPINFAPRVRTPTLMLNGRDDFRFPLEVSQKPMFRLLGVPDENKRHALIEGGHVPPRIEVIRETLDWLDRYLGPVATH